VPSDLLHDPARVRGHARVPLLGAIRATSSRAGFAEDADPDHIRLAVLIKNGGPAAVTGSADPFEVRRVWSGGIEVEEQPVAVGAVHDVGGPALQTVFRALRPALTRARAPEHDEDDRPPAFVGLLVDAEWCDPLDRIAQADQGDVGGPHLLPLGMDDARFNRVASIREIEGRTLSHPRNHVRGAEHPPVSDEGSGPGASKAAHRRIAFAQLAIVGIHLVMADQDRARRHL
jgi:hypothetical protein